jgi:hypothetical protein
MNRREFIAGASALLLAPLTVEAQQPKVPRIGVLLTVDLERTRARLSEELRRLGYVEGRYVLADFRLVPAGQVDRQPIRLRAPSSTRSSVRHEPSLSTSNP